MSEMKSKTHVDRHTDDSIMYLYFIPTGFHLENNVTYFEHRPPGALHAERRFKHMKLLRLNWWKNLNVFYTFKTEWMRKKNKKKIIKTQTFVSI